MIIKDTKGVRTLVIDAGPMLRVGLRVKDYAEEFITVPEVFNEIRDRQARQQLAIFPFEIKTRVPSEEAFKAGIYSIILNSIFLQVNLKLSIFVTTN